MTGQKVPTARCVTRCSLSVTLGMIRMDVRTRDMTELIAFDKDALWLRTNLLPAEVICKLGIMLSAVPIECVISWLQ